MPLGEKAVSTSTLTKIVGVDLPATAFGLTIYYPSYLRDMGQSCFEDVTFDASHGNKLIDKSLHNLDFEDVLFT